jgi:hypothetical protein
MGLSNPPDFATLVRDNMAAAAGAMAGGNCEDPEDGERVSRVIVRTGEEEVPFESGDLWTGTWLPELVEFDLALRVEGGDILSVDII